MSEKEPVIIKSTAPQQLKFSEVTGKITRQVNNFNDQNAAGAQGAGQVVVPDQEDKAAANRLHAPIGTGQVPANANATESGPAAPGSGKMAAPDQADKAAANRLHIPVNPEQTAANAIESGQAAPGSGKMVAPDQADKAAANRLHIPVSPEQTAANATESGQAAPGNGKMLAPDQAGKAAANRLHAPISTEQIAENVTVIEAGQAEQNVIKAASGAAENNMMHAPAEAPSSGGKLVAPDSVQGAVNVLVLPITENNQAGNQAIDTQIHADNTVKPEAHRPAQNIMRPGHEVAAAETIAVPVSKNEAGLNLLQVDAAVVDANVVYVDPALPELADPDAAHPDATPAPDGASATPGGDAPLEAGNAQPVVDEQEKAAVSIKLKISASVEGHLHTVEAETAQVNAQLERLSEKYASMEKRHKK